MPDAFLRKLSYGAFLTGEDCSALSRAVAGREDVPAHTDLIREGEQPTDVYVVLSGFACRYKLVADGGRQILAWLTPGDCSDLQVSLLRRMDHSIATLTECRIGHISRDSVEALQAHSPAIDRAFRWAGLVDDAILRQWLTGMGRRAAEKQIAHIFCELLERLRAVGMASGSQFSLAITQAELADAAGLSSVHVNRILQGLRDRGLIRWRAADFAILDVPGLWRLADFSPDYLHLDRHSQFNNEATAAAP